jgi:hypothetical protein
MQVLSFESRHSIYLSFKVEFLVIKLLTKKLSKKKRKHVLYLHEDVDEHQLMITWLHLHVLYECSGIIWRCRWTTTTYMISSLHTHVLSETYSCFTWRINVDEEQKKLRIICLIFIFFKTLDLNIFYIYIRNKKLLRYH